MQHHYIHILHDKSLVMIESSHESLRESHWATAPTCDGCERWKPVSTVHQARVCPRGCSAGQCCCQHRRPRDEACGPCSWRSDNLRLSTKRTNTIAIRKPRHSIWSCTEKSPLPPTVMPCTTSRTKHLLQLKSNCERMRHGVEIEVLLK